MSRADRRHCTDGGSHKWVTKSDYPGEETCRHCSARRTFDGGPCPVCDQPVARLLLAGHLMGHDLRGES